MNNNQAKNSGQSMEKYFFRASAADFKKIPGSPIAYWIGQHFLEAYSKLSRLGDRAVKGLDTNGSIDLFLKRWFEISSNSFKPLSRSSDYWHPISKGGEFRRWYGNNEYCINYQCDGSALKRNKANLRSADRYFKEGLTWTVVSSGGFAVRYMPNGFLFDQGGSGIFLESNDCYSLYDILGSLNSNFVGRMAELLCPTINFTTGDVRKFPIEKNNRIADVAAECISLSKADWDAFETSWDFTNLPLLHSEHHQPALKASYQNLRSHWHETTFEMQRLEEENNRIFINAYGLQDELTPEVPLSEITLTCNPHYRYGNNLTDEEREARLQSDTIAELISYAIGCMMGRYSLDREGLVYAHAGNEGFKALVEEGAYATFTADEDGILPLTADSWFPDDVAARIEQFVRTVWGAETLEENLQFIADSLCLSVIKPVKKGGETARETIRRYLSTQFFKDHMKTYKKRPIYWLFSSGKEKAFECLVYLHRYNEATLPRMRTEYVTPLLGQMAGRIERLRLQQAEAGTAEAKRIGKEIETLTKQLAELRAFDDELKHHADMRIRLDLDDGVKVNYGKFGTLLSEVKAITGDKGE